MLGLHLEDEVEFHEFVQQFVKVVDPEVLVRSCTLCYVIWEARNALIFRGQAPQLELLLARASSLTMPPPELLPPAAAPPMSSRWSKPGAGVIKMNFDAAWKQNRDDGYACVARTSEGEIMAAATAPNIATLNSLMAEAGAFRWALVLAMELGFRRVCMETDCLTLYQAWQRKDMGCSYLFSLLLDCRHLASCFGFFEFSFVEHSGNKVANYLARHSEAYGQTVWIEEVPTRSSLWSLMM